MRKINYIVLLFILFSFFLPLSAIAAASPGDSDAVAPVTDVPVLMYHHIAWEASGYTVITPDKLWNDLLYLKKNGYTPIHFQDLIASSQGRYQLPSRPVIITFDDGYASNYEFLFPMLKIFNFKANINPVISQVGKTPGHLPHFSWEEARKMKDSGLVEFGVHTYNLHGQHGFMPREGESERSYRQRISEDLRLATTLFEEQLGEKPIIFCYPYGWINPLAEELLTEYGYVVSLSINSGETQDFRCIHRINVSEETQLKDILF